MKTIDARTEDTKDRTLPWMMRLGGALIILLSLFLLERNVGYGSGDDVFCGLCLGLGLVAFALSWLPDREDQDAYATAP